MKKFIPAVAAITLASSTAVFAQSTTTTPTAPAPTPPASRDMTPPAASPPAAMPSATDSRASLTLSDEQAKNWINKVVYSSDDKNLGEVAAFNRDASGKVIEMHADIGGFLGLGETRVRVTPDQFKVADDRIILNMTGEQAKALPQLPK